MSALTRRGFLEKLGAGSVAASLPLLLPSVHAATAPYNGPKLNVALCGLGNYARMLAEGLQASQYCRLAGVVTGHADKAAAWQQQYQLPPQNIYNYNNFDGIAHNPNIDVVYIVLPNFLHKPFTIRAAQAGKHVITEKPMATTAADCEAMIAACNKAGVQLAVGYRMHFEPTQQEIMRLGQQKAFGPVRYLEAGLGYKTYNLADANDMVDINDDTQWRLHKTKAGGGPLMDLGVYCVQAARYVLGEEPVAVTAQFGPVHHAQRFTQVEESITWQMQFPGGAAANCTSSYGFNIDKLYASADDGYFELSPALSHGPFTGKTSAGILNIPPINQQASQLDAMAQYIINKQPMPAHINGSEGLRDIRIIEAIYKAAQTGGVVKLV
ncbi:Gfo/Idh/MocA family protein [Deminuibacter soli]|uniref:Gfo/Idh/MocA family oxidoreductase n=1 Tax=Deminuibacter soli TaxID=2291815 RepID=A0A3E1NMS5_9BACT|nr:Gfo/Idh/MocA family oxidoreductase [Deminuibacter soli]RFM29118.1 gfo/Idh/MocA family oxidoreductase [Deminuibacter soli]